MKMHAAFVVLVLVVAGQVEALDAQHGALGEHHLGLAFLFARGEGGRGRGGFFGASLTRRVVPQHSPSSPPSRSSMAMGQK